MNRTRSTGASGRQRPASRPRGKGSRPHPHSHARPVLAWGRLGGARTLDVAAGPFGFRLPVRGAGVLMGVVAVLAVVSVGALMQGDYRLSAGEVLRALFGHGQHLAQYFVTQVRAPRVVSAMLVGFALGLSGAVFQTVTGNDLGSPDIIGFTQGAATGALVQIILVGAGPAGVAAGAVVGGTLTSAAVWLLTVRTGLRGTRLVLVGLGLGGMLSAVNSLLVVRAPLGEAQTAQAWLIGSLNAMSWTKAGLLGLGLVVLGGVALWAHRPLAALRYGDELAAGLGVPVTRLRAVALFAGVLLVSLATAVTGPLAFVALAAPHICRSLTRGRGPGLFGAGLTGAALVLVADQIGLHALAQPVSVGVVTGALGGIYLVYLIARESKHS